MVKQLKKYKSRHRIIDIGLLLDIDIPVLCTAKPRKYEHGTIDRRNEFYNIDAFDGFDQSEIAEK
jgi:hypothetical protein